ncbi:molybdopterin-guanine dinucleotide biosynthesis protein B [Syntrophomonas erecta]
MIPIVSFVGRHNSGKTTILVGVLNRLAEEGIQTLVIKHSHGPLTPDLHDSGRLFRAGAQVVQAISSDMSLTYRRHTLTLEEILSDIPAGIDLVITEGFQEAGYPKIEVLREEIDTNIMDLDQVIARVADFEIPAQNEPCFKFDQLDDVVDLLIKTFNLES